MGKQLFEEYKNKVEAYLDSVLPPAGREPKVLHEAMRYSVFSGGKRLRPVIVLAVADIAGAAHEKIMPAACGLELIHNFSLVHDDLPPMDNDDYRRGRLTCHKKFGEAVAILAGDALLTLAFEVISGAGNCALIKAVAAAAGSEGMAGGQVLDIVFKDKKLSDALKSRINNLKTGRLFHICFEAPLYFGKVSREKAESLSLVAEKFGEAFQLRDDIEDSEGEEASMAEKIKILYRDMKKMITCLEGKGGLLGYISGRLFLP